MSAIEANRTRCTQSELERGIDLIVWTETQSKTLARIIRGGRQQHRQHLRYSERQAGAVMARHAEPERRRPKNVSCNPATDDARGIAGEFR